MDLRLFFRKLLIAGKHSTLKRILSAGATFLLTLFAYLKKDIIPQEILFLLIWLLLVVIIEISVLLMKYFAFSERPLVILEKRFSEITGEKKSNKPPKTQEEINKELSDIAQRETRRTSR